MAYDYLRKRTSTAQPFMYTPSYSDSTAVNFAGATLDFKMRGKGDGATKVHRAGEIVANVFTYWPTDEDVDTSGEFSIEWEVTYSNGKVELWPAASESSPYLTCLLIPVL